MFSQRTEAFQFPQSKVDRWYFRLKRILSRTFPEVFSDPATSQHSSIGDQHQQNFLKKIAWASLSNALSVKLVNSIYKFHKFGKKTIFIRKSAYQTWPDLTWPDLTWPDLRAQNICFLETCSNRICKRNEHQLFISQLRGKGTNWSFWA